MNDYTFRLSARLPDDIRLEIAEPQLDLSGPYHEHLALTSTGGGAPINESEYLILKGTGHDSQEAAWQAAEICRDFFTLALAGVRIAADFGDRAPKSGFAKAGLAMLEREHGKTVKDDVLGVSVFETSLDPIFASFKGNVVIGKNPEQFKALFKRAAKQGSALEDRERLAFDIFSSSFFEPSRDAQLMLLVTSIEVILDVEPRPRSSQKHVEQLIDITVGNEDLDQAERESLLGALRWLANESIGQAGRRIAGERLGDHEYDGDNASRFFSRAYGIRSRLVHGIDPFPSIDEITDILPPLKEFAADMICLPHFKSAI